MSDNPILDEVYRVREELFRECGGTMHGMYLRFSKRNPDLRYVETTRPRRVRAARPAMRTAARKKAAAAQ